MNNILALPEPETGVAVEFLDRMFPRLPRHLVAIKLNGRVTARTFSPGETEEMHAWIERYQGQANLYVHVNELSPSVVNKKATKSDVARARFVHVDVDDPKAEARIRSFLPPPTVVVSSGGGFHAYWALVNETDELGRVRPSI